MFIINDEIMSGIREQMRHMRLARVEPFELIVSPKVYEALGKPRRVSGVPVDCDADIKEGWMVR